MCKRQAIGWKCGCVYDNWEQCEVSVKSKTSPQTCVVTSRVEKQWKRPQLAGKKFWEFSQRFHVDDILIKEACCSPHCCQTSLDRTAEIANDHIATNTSRATIKSSGRRYCTVAGQHLFGCMPFFANGLWKTNAMRSHLDEEKEDDKILTLRHDLIAKFEKYEAYSFAEERLSALRGYESRVKTGLGLKSPLGELHWVQLRQKLKDSATQLMGYECNPKINPMPTLPYVRPEELTLANGQMAGESISSATRAPAPSSSEEGVSEMTPDLITPSSQDIEPGWDEVQIRISQDRELGQALGPASRQAWSFDYHDVKHLGACVSSYLDYLDQCRDLDSFSTAQGKVIWVADIARGQWVEKYFDSIIEPITNCTEAAGIQQEVVGKVTSLRDRLRGMRNTHIHWSPSLEATEQEELYIQLCEHQEGFD